MAAEIPRAPFVFGYHSVVLKMPKQPNDEMTKSHKNDW
jgi:hypothetical protein